MTVPILLPIVTKICGIDPIQFGVAAPVPKAPILPEQRKIGATPG